MRAGVINATAVWRLLLFGSVHHLISLAAVAATLLHSLTLKVRTCDERAAGTLDMLSLSFCGGESNCTTGRFNLYNSEGYLFEPGIWNELEVPLDYTPTTMVMEISDNDAWCMDEVVWEGGANLLGRGAKIYLDGDLGLTGCNFGVHSQTGWFYPCQSSWRFFNILGSDDYKYEVAVKPCSSSKLSVVLVSLCSESSCDDEVGDVVSFNLTTGGAEARSGWTTHRVSAGFNPVAMKITNVGDHPWCAEEVAFNEFRLASPTLSPWGRMLGIGEERHFYNVQVLGAEAIDRDESKGGKDDSIDDAAWKMATEIIIVVVSGLIFTATIASVSFVKSRYFLRSNQARDGNVGTDGRGDLQLCSICRVHLAALGTRRQTKSVSDECHEPLIGLGTSTLGTEDTSSRVSNSEKTSEQSALSDRETGAPLGKKMVKKRTNDVGCFDEDECMQFGANYTTRESPAHRYGPDDSKRPVYIPNPLPYK